MTSYKPWDIITLPFPYTEGKKGKVRPSLIVSGAMGHNQNFYYVVMITTLKNRELIDGDVMLKNGKDYGVLVDSIIRCSRMATLNKKMIVNRIGHIPRTIQQKVHQKITTLIAEPVFE